jgi:hypothetical protein
MSLWTTFAEEQRTRRALKAANQVRHFPRTPAQPINRARLWQVAVTAFIATLLFLWGILHPLVWRAFR